MQRILEQPSAFNIGQSLGPALGIDSEIPRVLVTLVRPVAKISRGGTIKLFVPSVPTKDGGHRQIRCTKLGSSLEMRALLSGCCPEVHQCRDRGLIVRM